MNKLSLIQNVNRTIRGGVAAAAVAVAGMGIVALAGSAPAGAIVVRTGPVTPIILPSCPSPVSLNNTYSYTFNTTTDQILSLSGSGCSQSATPVEVYVYGPGDGSDVTLDDAGAALSVNPTHVVGTNEYSFSFTANQSNQPWVFQGGLAFGPAPCLAQGLYLTQNAANAGFGGRSQCG